MQSITSIPGHARIYFVAPTTVRELETGRRVKMTHGRGRRIEAEVVWPHRPGPGVEAYWVAAAEGQAPLKGGISDAGQGGSKIPRRLVQSR